MFVKPRSTDAVNGDNKNRNQSSTSKDDTGVFSDFRKAWRARFPNSELPKQWEDDVRGNLTKHKQKVTQLKEELEKEEFYVEYLERLLKDVERVRNEKSLQPQQPQAANPVPSARKTTQQQPPPDAGTDGEFVTVITVSSYGEINKPPTKSSAVKEDPALIENPLYQDMDNVITDKKRRVSYALITLEATCVVSECDYFNRNA